jgi:hypothetical protein
MGDELKDAWTLDMKDDVKKNTRAWLAFKRGKNVDS